MDSTPTSNPRNTANVQQRSMARNARRGLQSNGMCASRNNHYASHLNQGPYFTQPHDESHRAIRPLRRSSHIQSDPRASQRTVLSDLDIFPHRVVPATASEELEVQENSTLPRARDYHGITEITESYSTNEQFLHIAEEGNHTPHLNPGPYFIQPQYEGHRVIRPLSRRSHIQSDPRAPQRTILFDLDSFPHRFAPVAASEELEVQENSTLPRAQDYHGITEITESYSTNEQFLPIAEEGNHTPHLNPGPYFIQQNDDEHRVIRPLPRRSHIQSEPRLPPSTPLSDLDSFPHRFVPVRASEELEVQENSTVPRARDYHRMAQIRENYNTNEQFLPVAQEDNRTSHLTPGPYFIQLNEDEQNPVVIPARLHTDSHNQTDPSARTLRISVSNDLANFPPTEEYTLMTEMSLMAFEELEVQFRKGLSDEEINEIPSISVTKQNVQEKSNCTVCCVDYNEGEVVNRLPCNHLFHKQCIATWLKANNSCPNCRKILKIYKV